MKRKGLIAVLAAIMVMASSIFCFADVEGLKIMSSYPEDGQKNTSIENVGVKLTFNHSFNNEAVRKADAKLVKIVNSNGKAIDIKVLFSDDEEGMVLVVADNTDRKATKITNGETYKLVIDGAFADDHGDTLGETTTIEFSTYNQKLNNIINMAMMFVMFGGIMFVTLKQQRDQQTEQKAANDKTKDNSFNPYKEAKRTGKTVEEVMAEEAKRQEKASKKKKKKKDDADDKSHIKIVHCADYLTNVYHVHEPASIKKAKK